VAPLLAGLEGMLERKNSTFFVCDEGPTLADLAVYNFVTSSFPGLQKLDVDLSGYTKLMANVDLTKKALENITPTRLKSKATESKAPEEMPELFYFDAEGRGQLTRLAFAAGGISFEDTRYSFSAWPAVKSNLESVPAKCFGQMPCIKHGDVLLAQSVATAVYAAELGIYAQGRLGSKAVAAQNRALDLMAMEGCADLQGLMYTCLFGTDESKEAGKKALPEGVKPLLLGLERMWARKTCDGPFLVSQDGPTLGDLAVFVVVKSKFPGLEALGVDVSPYTMLNKVVGAVAQDDKVMHYMTK